MTLKKRYLIFCILIWIAVIGIAPLNVYVVSMSDIVLIAGVIAIVIAGALFRILL